MHVYIYTHVEGKFSPEKKRKLQHSRPTPSKYIHPQKKKKKDSRPRLLQPTHIRTPLLRVPNHKNAFHPERHASLSHSILMIFFSPYSAASYMYIRYFLSLSLSLAPTESFADLLLRMLWGVLLAEQRAWFRIVSFLHAVGTSFFFLLLSSMTLIVMDRPDFCFFFFFFFTPLHHPIQHPQVGRWAVETITCGGPLGIYSAIHSRREEVNTYLSTPFVPTTATTATTTDMPSCWKLAWCFCSDPGRRPKISSPVHLLLKVIIPIIIIIWCWWGWLAAIK